MTCTCEPMVVEDEESSHDGDCPRFWDDLHTAELGLEAP